MVLILSWNLYAQSAAAVSVEAESGVPSEVVQLFQRIFSAATEYYAQTFRVSLSVPVRVTLYAATKSYADALVREAGWSESNAMAAFQPEGHSMIVYQGRRLFVNTANPTVSRQIAEGSVDLWATLAHETAHLYQSELAGFRGEPFAWILEGTAELYAYHFLGDRGMLSYPQLVDRRVALLRERQEQGSLPRLGDLASGRTWEQFARIYTRYVVYSVAWIGCERLVATRDDAAMIAYFRSFRTGADADRGFQQAFGMTPSQYYQEFTAYLAGR